MSTPLPYPLMKHRRRLVWSFSNCCRHRCTICAEIGGQRIWEKTWSEQDSVLIALVKAASTPLTNYTPNFIHWEQSGFPVSMNKDTNHSGRLSRQQLRCGAEIRSICFSSDIRTSSKTKPVSFLIPKSCVLCTSVCIMSSDFLKGTF